MNYIKNTTGTLFFRILKLTGICLSFVLGLFCTTRPTVVRVSSLYGMPWADYKVSGTIYASNTHKALNGMKVTLTDTAYGSRPIHTQVTDSSGKYDFKFSGAPWNNSWILQAGDIDSTANGSYINKDTTITIPDSMLDSAVGAWYNGHGEKHVDLNLDPK